MATFVLTDLAHDLWVESFAIDTLILDLPRPGAARSPSAGCAAAGATGSI